MKKLISTTILFLGSLVLLISASIYFYNLIHNYGNSIEREKLLIKATTAASLISIDALKETLNPSFNISSPIYKTLVKRLNRIKETEPNCRFAYLMAKNSNNQIFIIADTEPADSKEFSPPGEIYNEASQELINVFSNKNPFVEGPFTDRWGIWVSGITPIIDPETQEILAVLGIDVDAKLWSRTMAGYSFVATALMAAWVIIFALSWGIVFKIKHDNMKLNHEIECHKETIIKLEAAFDNIERLEEIVPICAVCKKVRDDKGYWEQVESYMKKHTEARFSHSLCPTCLDTEKKKYPEYFGDEISSSK